MPQRKPTPMLYPRGIEKQYTIALNKLITPLFQFTREFIFPQINNFKQQFEIDTRRDNYSEDISAVIEGVQIQYATEVKVRNAEELATEFAIKTEGFNKNQFNRQVKSILGISPLMAEPWLIPLRDSWVKENVSLIRSISDTYFTQIEGIIRRGVESGISTRDIVKDLTYRFGVTRRRAKLIARDQIGKYNGNLTRNRSQDLGVTHFIWRTAKDERVRDIDSNNEGKLFSWKKGDSQNTFPGGKVQCRCTAENDYSIFF